MVIRQKPACREAGDGPYHALPERADLLNRLLRTRMVGGVGVGLLPTQLDPNRTHFDKATGTVLRNRNSATSMLGIRGDARTKSAGIHLASEWVQVGAVKRFDMVNYGKPVLVFKLPRK